MALAVARKGHRPIVMERAGIAAGASGNSYGLVHGGLRYLQNLDVMRWRKSRRAQAWYLSHFPQFARPLRCVMPLYRRCMRSVAAFRLASLTEHALTRLFDVHTNLPNLEILSSNEVGSRFAVPQEGLAGGAAWHDVEIDDMPGLITTMLAQACNAGGTVMTDTEALDLLVDDGRVVGVRIADRRSGETTAIEAHTVINCAGSWLGSWHPDRKAPTAAVLAFNLVLDLDLGFDSALAVSEIPGRGRSYFLRRYAGGGTFAGTCYKPAPGMAEPRVSIADVDAFRATLERALPDVGIAEASVRHVLAGLLPDKDGRGVELASADHHRRGDPIGYHGVLGAKLTTAPLLSFDVADRIWPVNARG